jgi:hypothetical protein
VLRGRRATDAVICLDVWVVGYSRLVGTRKPNAYVCDKAIREERMTIRTKQMEQRRLRMRNAYGCSGGAHRTMVQWGTTSPERMLVRGGVHAADCANATSQVVPTQWVVAIDH